MRMNMFATQDMAKPDIGKNKRLKLVSSQAYNQLKAAP
jgi:hypothetical protein